MRVPRERAPSSRTREVTLGCPPCPPPGRSRAPRVEGGWQKTQPHGPLPEAERVHVTSQRRAVNPCDGSDGLQCELCDLDSLSLLLSLHLLYLPGSRSASNGCSTQMQRQPHGGAALQGRVHMDAFWNQAHTCQPICPPRLGAPPSSGPLCHPDARSTCGTHGSVLTGLSRQQLRAGRPNLYKHPLCK